MLEVDDSEFTPDHIEFLREWANNLNVSMEVLLARIVLATSEGDQYVEGHQSTGPFRVSEGSYAVFLFFPAFFALPYPPFSSALRLIIWAFL